MRIYAFADEASSQVDLQIEAMKRNNLQGLEIRNVDGVNVSDITLEKAAEVRSKLDAAGLVTWAIGSPIGKIDILDSEFENHLKKFRHTMEVAKILGAKNIRLFSFFIPENEDPFVYKDEVIRRLKALVAEAEGTGITLCHENEKGIYGDTAVRCLEIYQAVEGLKGVFDPANFVQCGQDTLEAWQMLSPYIVYLHIKDAKLDGNIVPAGTGNGNVAEILKRFQEQGGCDITLEPHLAVFDGLKNLERDSNVSQVGQLAYPTNDAAFDAGCNALKKLI